LISACIVNGLVASYEPVSDFPKEPDSRRLLFYERGVHNVPRSAIKKQSNAEGGLLGHR
jgi:hypothetical protein